MFLIFELAEKLNLENCHYANGFEGGQGMMRRSTESSLFCARFCLCIHSMSIFLLGPMLVNVNKHENAEWKQKIFEYYFEVGFPIGLAKICFV